MIVAQLGIVDASWIEILWTAIAAVGFTFAARNLREALRDLRASHRRPGDRAARDLVSRGAVVRESLLAFIQAIFITFGVLAWWLPAAPPLHLPWIRHLFSLVVQYGLVAGGFALVLASCVTSYVRRRLHVLDAQREESDRPPE